MSAAARAEARRKAILSRGTDRLAKLTTSGRGEDNLAYVRELTPDPPLPSFPPSGSPSPSRNLGNFVGEETTGMPLPTANHFPSTAPRSRVPSNANPPRSRVPSSAQTNANPFGMPDPSGWSAEQQQQFLQALMGGAGAPGAGGPALTSGREASPDPFAGMAGMDGNNPFAAMMAAAAGGGGAGAGAGGFPPVGAGMGMGADGMGGLSGMMGGMGKAPDVAPPKTRAQRLMPALHLVAVWSLLLYFILVREPAVHEGLMIASRPSLTEGQNALSFAWRWRQLASSPWLAEFNKGWGVQAVPFFWAFVTLELVLHSLRIFSGFDAIRPPTLVALALPHLPPPIPALYVHSMKYLQMGSLFLDDVAAVIVGIGLVIWFSTWRAA
ncbi:hypothetical protein C8F04DRAFT_1275331 [Mycena alexandri]|uniref:Uncharacterized protein n=1 Tax=Mycena alexandri TaxID=1745969 RepID=A0AAD6S6Y0_9AGAR|nr:hypothetical protein C8F04DRAFT_1275331 [Mycena alexandri]